MKLKILLFLSCFSILTFAQSESLISENAIKQVANQMDTIDKQLMDKNNSDEKNYFLNKTQTNLLPILNACISQQGKILAHLEREKILYNQAQDIEYTKIFEEKFLQKYTYNKKLQKHCLFLKNKIEADLYQYQKLNYENLPQKLISKNESFYDVLKNINFSQLPLPYRGEMYKQLLQQTNLKINLSVIFLGILFLGLLKLLNILGVKNNLTNISILSRDFILSSAIYVICAPIIFHILKVEYQHTLVFALQAYREIALLILFWFGWLYFYKRLKITAFYKDLLKFIASFLTFYLLIVMNLLCSFYEFIQTTPMNILLMKYGFLISLQGAGVYLYYWLIHRLLGFQYFSKNIKLCFKAFFVIILLNFIAGLCGYLEWAINLDLSLMISGIVSLWVFLFYKYSLKICDELDDRKYWLGQKFKSLFGEKNNYAKLNLKIFIFYFLIGISIKCFFVLWTVWFLPIDFFEHIYNFYYSTFNADGARIRVISFQRILGLFMLLNLLSIFFAHKMTSSIIKQKENGKKFFAIVHFIFVAISLLVCFGIAGVNIAHLDVILGSLLLGLGFCLKNVVSGIIASFILFCYEPYKVGDFISILKTSGAENDGFDEKGYVRKIDLFETYIETLDGNMRIVPNYILFSQGFLNYTFEKMTKQTLILKYQIGDIKDTQKLKEKIQGVLSLHHDFIRPKNKYYDVYLTPSPNGANCYELELVLIVNHIEKIQNIILILHQDIQQTLEKDGYNILFLSSSHAYL